jgi:hypothetical protein
MEPHRLLPSNPAPIFQYGSEPSPDFLPKVLTLNSFFVTYNFVFTFLNYELISLTKVQVR